MAGGYASPAMNSDIVNPIPVRTAPAHKNGQSSELSGRVARPSDRTASQLIAIDTHRLAKYQAGDDGHGNGIVESGAGDRDARIGEREDRCMIAKPTQGCTSVISSCSSGEMTSPRRATGLPTKVGAIGRISAPVLALFVDKPVACWSHDTKLSHAGEPSLTQPPCWCHQAQRNTGKHRGMDS